MDPREACPGCGTHVAPGLLDCPSCHRLVHAEELNRLAAEANSAAGDASAELAAWRRAMELLPPGSRQHATVSAKVDGLSRRVDSRAPAKASKPPPKWLAGLGAAGLLIWKLKVVLLFVGTKAKLLFMGLTKGTTFISMFLSFGVYWSLWGWKFAAGLVVSIYIHEMGHVAELRRFGIRATAPMFIPGFGAMVRLNQYPANPREDSRVGLAGPIWGLGAALASWGLFHATGETIFAAIARIGAWINLFNLIPVWQLDGSRGFRSLTRIQRWAVVAAAGGMLLWTQEGLLALLLILAVVRAFERGPKEPDQVGLIQFLVLVVALSAMTLIPVPGVEGRE